MADDEDPKAGELTTAFYGWTKPTVGASDDQWGGYLNADLDGIDSVVHGIDTRPIPAALTVSDTAPASPTVGQMWFDSVGGQTYLWVDDGNTKQWVVAVNPGVGQGAYLPLNGGALSGPVSGPSATFANLSAPQAIGDNRLINGDMRIDQRNGGASGTAIATYTIDRWRYGSNLAKLTWGRNLNAVAGPAAFPYYFGFQSSSAYAAAAGDWFVIYQPIEADAVSDFAWGTANAQPVTLSFWARSSLTGTFSGAIGNTAQTRAYPFTYSLPTANTWTKIAVTIPGDTVGAWVMSGNAGSVSLQFDLGSGSSSVGPAGVWGSGPWSGATGTVSVVGTNAATFYITGVKLEIGSVATPFNRQSLAKSLADCQRYYQTGSAAWFGNATSGNNYGYFVNFCMAMRAAPATVTITTGSVISFAQITTQGFVGYVTASSTAAASFNSTYAVSAEL